MSTPRLLASRTGVQAGVAAAVATLIAGLVLGLTRAAADVAPAPAAAPAERAGLPGLAPPALDAYSSAMLGDYPLEHAAASICRPFTLCIR